MTTSLPSPVHLTAKDFKSDQEVRWCPGCGDFTILAAVQNFLPELGIPRENLVFVSGIGCSSRFPYYVNTYGVHSIHGRAPAVATGLAVSRPELSVWVVTGDGDSLSIGGNHLIHAMRRNVNLTILLFNNRIYGLTKGQFSPTSEFGKVTKTSPLGSIDRPFNPLSLAIGAGATFVARSIATDRQHMTGVLRAAAAHRGASFVEIYQNCEIFNDGAFSMLGGPEGRGHWVPLGAGEPLRYGPDGRGGVVRDPSGTGLVAVPDLEAAGETPGGQVVVHDPGRVDPTYAFALSHIGDAPGDPTPFGVFRDVAAPTYEELVDAQLAAQTPGTDADLEAVLAGRDSWEIE
jgi:2-oxoglutarate ferredoxin oxidoreductase subunit beta